MLELQKYLIENGVETSEEIIELMKQKKVIVKAEDGLLLFIYDLFADFKDPVVKECRGIILYHEKDFPIACYPFNKFGNYGESYADTIDWNTAKVKEKVDGSLIKLWYDSRPSKQCWRWSTNRSIDASKALISDTLSFMEVISMTTEYTEILDKMHTENGLDKEMTYMFELVSMYNRVVIKYDVPRLYHIGSRNIRTLQEDDSLRIINSIPKEYDLNSLDSVLLAAEKLNENNSIKQEGFVVVDANYNRIKVKSPEYVAMHFMRDFNNTNIKKVLKLILSNDIEEYINYLPEMSHVVRYYQFQIEELKYQAKCTCDIVKYMNSHNKSRKDIALAIKDRKTKAFGFRYLDSNISAEEQIANLDIVNLANYITKYNPTKFK